MRAGWPASSRLVASKQLHVLQRPPAAIKTQNSRWGSSGVPAFDAAAMAMVRGGSFPPIPPEISYNSVPFTIPVRFGR